MAEIKVHYPPVNIPHRPGPDGPDTPLHWGEKGKQQFTEEQKRLTAEYESKLSPQVTEFWKQKMDKIKKELENK